MKKKILIPKNARKVFEGVMYEVYQWKQKMFDNSLKTFERIKRPDVVAIIATVGNKIIIQNQTQPFKGNFLSLPGGRMEKGEKPLQAAKREFLEETGYTSRNISLWKVIYRTSGSHFNEYVYIFRDCEKVQNKNLDSGEKIRNSFVSFEEFLNLTDSDVFRHNAIAIILLRMRLNIKEKNKFKKLLFGK